MLIKNIIYLTSINLLNCAIIAYSPSECKTQNGTACVFPFFYKGVKYSGCTTVDNRETPWCSTRTDGDVNYIDHYWGNCAQDCPSPTTTTSTTTTTTTTTITTTTITTITTTTTSTTTITTTTTSSSTLNPLGCKTQNGTTCVFPFIYKGVKYSVCTTVDNRETPWCSTNTDKEGNYVDNYWGNCAHGCLSPTTTTTAKTVSTTSSSSTSTSGCKTQNDTVCVFPFIYKGVKYSGCTTMDNEETPWCSTVTDKDRNYVDHPKSFVTWENCGQICSNEDQVDLPDCQVFAGQYLGAGDDVADATKDTNEVRDL